MTRITFRRHHNEYYHYFVSFLMSNINVINTCSCFYELNGMNEISGGAKGPIVKLYT